MSHFLNSSTHYNGEDGDQPSRESSSSTPPLPGHHNEVFLSFRGETRRGLTDHLYKRLYNAGISVFRDKEGLPVGERNWPELLKAIEASKISIPIISPDYASSEWCLNELVHILKCKKTFGQHVIPIFYRVKPSDVRKSLDVSEEESQLCNKRRLNFDGMHVQEWKDALMEVSYMTGLESEKVADGHEGELVEIVVAKVLKALTKHALVVSDDLVGVEDHVEKIMNVVNVEGSNDVCAILIHGMGGIGKTTLAKVLYNQLAHQFDCHSFLANVRETWLQHKGKVDLQQQLIADILGQKQSISSVDEGVKIIRDRFKHKKVLILLDDVDCRDQLNALAGKQDWFGRGSMLIITSRINNMLKEWEGIISYELNGLKDDQSYLLFCKHAFKRSHSIPNEFQSIAKEIVSTTGGLPLAIEVIGCLLYNEDRSIWEEKLKELREIPDGEVQSKLKISFNALKPEEQDIFLDIACHSLIRESREFARHMWDSYGFHSELKIRKLISMSLIKIGGEEEEELIIHDQLRDLGREIVRQESRDNPGKRSRLWEDDEALEVLEYEQGTGKIQTLSLWHPVRCTSKQFKRMTKLRYLCMSGVNLEGDFDNLFQNLRWLFWDGGELDFMGSNFIPKKLVVLELYLVNITKQWMGWSQMKHLRVLKLELCNALTALPDISALKQLEVLILRECEDLINIHPSIGKLKRLTKLELCEIGITQLPNTIGDLCYLRSLILYCYELKRLPNLPDSLTSLEFGDLSIKTLPDFSKLTNLEHLKFRHEFYKPETTMNFRNLNRITALRLKCCCIMLHCLDPREHYMGIDCFCEDWYEIEEMSENTDLLLELPSTLVNLIVEDGYTLRTLSNFSDLKNLTVLRIENCPKLMEIDGLDGAESLTSVMIGSCKKISKLGGMGISVTHMALKDLDSLVSLPDLSSAKKLVDLKIYSCGKLVQIQGLDNAECIESVAIDGCSFLQRIGDLSNLKRLTTLKLCNCEKLSEIRGMGNSVTHLELEHLDSLGSLPDLLSANKLEDLKIYSCGKLVEIQGLDNAECIESVAIDGCSSLQRIGDLSNLKRLTTLKLCNCEKLSKIRGMGISVTHLELEHLDSLVSLPDLSSVNKLEDLKIYSCGKLVEIQGLDNAECIESVAIDECSSLQRIGDLSNLKRLTTLKLCNCEKLSEIRGMGNSVTHLELEHLDSLGSLPDLSSANKLEDLKIYSCGKLVEIQGLDNVECIESVAIDGCSSLQRIGDLSNLKRLTTLKLCNCEKLSVIRGMGNSVTHLELEHLDSLGSLPDLSSANKLEDLKIYSCGKLVEIQGLNNAECIESVAIDGCSSLERIGDLSNLKRLTTLKLCNCEKLSEIRGMGILVTHLELEHLDSLVSLPKLSSANKLEDLKIYSCGKLVEIQGLDNAECIESVAIDGCSSLQRIGDLSNLKRLTTLKLCNCEKLSEIRGMGILVTHLELEHLDSLVSLPDLSSANKLEDLKIYSCGKLVEIQGLDNAECIESVAIDGCSSLQRIGDLSNLKRLTTLKLCNCEKLSEIRGMGILVTHLELEHLDSLVSLPDLSSANKLEDLKIYSCGKLVEIQGLDNAECIESVAIDECSSLQRIGDLSNLKRLTTLKLCNCEKLSVIRGMGNSVMHLELEHLDTLGSLPDLSSANKLEDLKIYSCGKLVEIQGLDNAECIESVAIDGCSSLERISDLSNLKRLTTLKLCNCEKLSDIQGIKKLTSLRSLSIHGCHPQIKFLYF